MFIIGSKSFYITQAILMIAGFSQLLRSDSCYVPYLFVLVIGILCLFCNIRLQPQKRNICSSQMFLAVAFPILFACMITLANYHLWKFCRIDDILELVAIFGGTFFAFWNILCWMMHNIRKITWNENKSWKPLTVFFVSFGIIAGINLLVLFSCSYPGKLTPDSISQMTQIFTNEYSNHHPFYHTQIINLFVSIGLYLFHEINAAVACYSVFSILFMAATFSFAVAMVAEIHAPKWIVVLLQLFFTLMPYHILYSMTMWKDVIFGAMVLLFLLFLFRCVTQMRLKPFNYTGLAISSLGICLLRSNGYFAFVFSVLVFSLLWRFQKKKILFLMVAALACSFVLKHPVLKAIGVTQPDLIESLSIPAQQIARAVVDQNDLTDDQRELLSKIVDIDRIPENYDPELSDPIKNLVREKGNQEFIRSHAGDFIRLYVSLGIKYPATFASAWVDQTRGYWNAGYYDWVWTNYVYANNLGIHRTIHSSEAGAFLNWYLDLFTNQPALWIFLCIGFFDWLLLIALFIAIIRRDKLGIMLTIPNIMVVLSLLIATPVCSEFRYNYAVFCTLPVIFALVLRPDSLPDFHGKEKN